MYSRKHTLYLVQQMSLQWLGIVIIEMDWGRSKLASLNWSNGTISVRFAFNAPWTREQP